MGLSATGRHQAPSWVTLVDDASHLDGLTHHPSGERKAHGGLERLLELAQLARRRRRRRPGSRPATSRLGRAFRIRLRPVAAPAPEPNLRLTGWGNLCGDACAVVRKSRKPSCRRATRARARGVAGWEAPPGSAPVRRPAEARLGAQALARTVLPEGLPDRSTGSVPSGAPAHQETDRPGMDQEGVQWVARSRTAPSAPPWSLVLCLVPTPRQPLTSGSNLAPGVPEALHAVSLD
jgi:hypothetical protein